MEMERDGKCEEEMMRDGDGRIVEEGRWRKMERESEKDRKCD